MLICMQFATLRCMRLEVLSFLTLFFFLFWFSANQSLATSLGFLLFLGEEEDDLCFYFVKLHIMKVRLLQVFSSVWVMMNKRTRRLSQMPEEVRGEIEPYFIEHAAVLDEDSRKLPKLNDNPADYMRRE
ncbi:uncharacterized protein LOC131256741 [Magnolia sinica]|uniref:uncharacterized protein LOC131256741 n=1 Tax=Magnolia sinica TaxID=86752 RepID=UPI002657D24C|nr:uncharacterized protein LOC131256741 [Magnolia sinica]